MIPQNNTLTSPQGGMHKEVALPNIKTFCTNVCSRRGFTACASPCDLGKALNFPFCQKCAGVGCSVCDELQN